MASALWCSLSCDSRFDNSASLHGSGVAITNSVALDCGGGKSSHCLLDIWSKGQKSWRKKLILYHWQENYQFAMSIEIPDRPPREKTKQHSAFHLKKIGFFSFCSCTTWFWWISLRFRLFSKHCVVFHEALSIHAACVKVKYVCCSNGHTDYLWCVWQNFRWIKQY